MTCADAQAPEPCDPDLLLDLDGFEGPIDLLLALAREQKVDLARISILQLADQYLEFIARSQALRLEIAADYLVMAAWLAYLKSRLLLPEKEREEVRPTAEEMADALAFQLRRLEAVKAAAAQLLARPRLGETVWPRGAPEGTEVVLRPRYQISLFDLLRSYPNRRGTAQPQLTIVSTGLHTVEAALQRLERNLGRAGGWQSLLSFLPAKLRGGLPARSAVAATLLAALELSKLGRARLRQDRLFGPLYLRPADPPASSSGNGVDTGAAE